MRDKVFSLRALAAEARWGFGVALAIFLTIALCGCGEEKGVPITPTRGQWLIWPTVALCAALFLFHVLCGTHEAIANWRDDKVKRELKMQALAEMSANAHKALWLALKSRWSESHELLASLPRIEERDTLKLAVSLLDTREKAKALVPEWIGIADILAARDTAKYAGMRGVPTRRERAGGVLNVPIDPAVCQHPLRVAQCCGTCGEDLRSAEADDGA